MKNNAAKKSTLSSERRGFGRRRTHLHAFVHAVGRSPIPCLVRNISDQGALLELEHPGRLPSYFTLKIAADGFSADCEIRHKTEHGAGVFFCNINIEPGGVDSRYARRDLRAAA